MRFPTESLRPDPTSRTSFVPRLASYFSRDEELDFVEKCEISWWGEWVGGRVDGEGREGCSGRGDVEVKRKLVSLL